MRIGEALYLDGQPMTECANCYQRAGWLAAEAADYREDVGYSECAPYIQ
jgi:hypothetical protein